MPSPDLLPILLAHDHWATTQLLDACNKLPDDALHRRFEIGPGSLHDALTHLIAATRAWTDSLVGRDPPRPRPDADGQRRTPEELRTLLNESSQELSSESQRRPLAELITRRLRDGRTIQLTRAAVLAQVITHNMHHRAQCLNMLRQLGVSPLPPSSVAEWTMLGEPTRMRQNDE